MGCQHKRVVEGVSDDAADSRYVTDGIKEEDEKHLGHDDLAVVLELFFDNALHGDLGVEAWVCVDHEEVAVDNWLGS